MSVRRFSYKCLESDTLDCSVHVVLHDVYVEVQQAHPVEPRLEFALCWSDAKGFGWVGETALTLSHFGQEFS